MKFPEHIHTHSPLQTFYFNDAGILQRHDYSVDVVGGTSTANYAREPKVFDGIVIPTKRRAYSIGRDNRPLLERIAASIDFQDLSFTWLESSGSNWTKNARSAEANFWRPDSSRPTR